MFPKLVMIAKKCPTTVVGVENPNHIEKVGMGSEQAIEDANISEASQDNSTLGEATVLEEKENGKDHTTGNDAWGNLGPFLEPNAPQMVETDDDDASVDNPMAEVELGADDAMDNKDTDKTWSGLHANKV